MKLNIALALVGLSVIILSVMSYNIVKQDYQSAVDSEKKRYSEVCIEGVTYISLNKSFSVMLNTESKVILCEGVR
jgi:hypothetical protein